MINNYKSNNTKNPINIIFLSKILNLIVKMLKKNSKNLNCKIILTIREFRLLRISIFIK